MLANRCDRGFKLYIIAKNKSSDRFFHFPILPYLDRTVMSNPVFMPANFPLMYRAVGQLQGRYIPSPKKIAKGVLLTDDGMFIPARLVARAEWMGKTSPEKIQGELIWSVYPHTQYPDWFERMQRFLPDEEIVAPAKTLTAPPFWLELRDTRQPGKEQAIEEIKQGNNYFSIRGEICQQDEQEGKLIVRIRRNKIPPGKEDEREYKPIEVSIDGFLPGKVVGQFWDLEASREGNLLILENGSFVAELSPPSPPEEQPKENKKTKETQKSELETQTQPKRTGKIIRLVK